MDEQARHLRLVQLCLTNGPAICVHWMSDALRDRATQDLGGLKPAEVVGLLLSWTRAGGTLGVAVSSPQDSRVAFDYVFYAVIAVDGLQRGVYVKLGLKPGRIDEVMPEVVIVSCHQSSY